MSPERRVLTPETAADSDQHRDAALTRWQALSAEERRAATAPAVEARARRTARRKAIQGAADAYTTEAFTCAMALVSDLKSEDGQHRRTASETYSARLMVAALDLAAALARIDAVAVES